MKGRFDGFMILANVLSLAGDGGVDGVDGFDGFDFDFFFRVFGSRGTSFLLFGGC